MSEQSGVPVPVPVPDRDDLPPGESPRPHFEPDKFLEPTEPQADSGLDLPHPKAGQT
ncbi:hypothetical protein [Streptomyces sp. NPDC048438]|uniref:hypothetical protein n=1 Tax=Streptomyces sp. NPDC048438 TaxID=3365551 RepID=UPI003710AF76